MCTFEMYKIAIEGRNNHYKNYNEWANRYSIITGALFAAYYAVVEKNNLLLSFIVSFVGLFATLCWYLSMQGYYTWMKSWIEVVWEYEKKLNELNDCCNNCSKNKCECIKKCSDKKAYVYSSFIGNREKKNYVSTQKVTITLISVMGLFQRKKCLNGTS